MVILNPRALSNHNVSRMEATRVTSAPERNPSKGVKGLRMRALSPQSTES